MDQAFKVELVRKALQRTREACCTKGLEKHWEVFLRHTYQGLPYKHLCTDLHISPQAAAGMNRTAEKLFINAVHELIMRDGVSTHEINSEIRSLLED
jgi:hypothetical protein